MKPDLNGTWIERNHVFNGKLLRYRGFLISLQASALYTICLQKDPLRFRYVQVSLNYDFNVLKPHKDQVLYSLYREPLGRLVYILFME